jgi:3-deoxy-manno-octulosonate cytidylyltransferase (CMP-KDO synthetase)
MAVVAIIPARMGSTRLPGKPLLKETGKYLIQHVVEQVRLVKGLDQVVVATDDERIVRACKEFDAEAVMTRPEHASGTDRIAEVADRMQLADEDVVVNVQGDEPEVPPRCVAEMVSLLRHGSAPMATLATPLPADQAGDPSKVKVVFDLNGRAMYFSRAKIPCDRDGSGEAAYYLHLGMYAYRAADLRRTQREARATPRPGARLRHCRRGGDPARQGDRHAARLRGLRPAVEGVVTARAGVPVLALPGVLA